MAGLGSSGSGALEDELRSASPVGVAVLRWAADATVQRVAALYREEWVNLKHFAGLLGWVRELWRRYWGCDVR